jgi:hypothetical protein
MKRLLLAAMVCASLTGCHRPGSTPIAGKAGCGIKAELHGVSFPPLWNPNTMDLEYLVTNLSGEDYELPNSFRVLSKSPDNVLYADKNVETGNLLPELSFPNHRFFPRGHTVAFVVSVNLYVLDHRPSTEEDKKELEKQLSGTKSYVIFDEQHGCEFELPVAGDNFLAQPKR